MVLGAPEALRPVLERFAEDVGVRTTLAPGAAFVLAFVRTAADIAEQAQEVGASTEGDVKVWMAYPKKSSPLHDPEVSRDESWSRWAPRASRACARSRSTTTGRRSASPRGAHRAPDARPVARDDRGGPAARDRGPPAGMSPAARPPRPIHAALPSVDAVLRREDMAGLLARAPRATVVDAVRAALAGRRHRGAGAEGLAGEVAAALRPRFGGSSTPPG